MEQSDERHLGLLGVAERLSDLEAFGRAFPASSCEFFYCSILMIFLTVVVEQSFPGVTPRNCQGEHTRLPTEESLQRMNELRGVEPVAQ